MRKRGLVVLNAYSKHPNNLYKRDRLKEEFLSLGIELETKDALDLLPLCDGKTSEISEIDEYAFALNFDKDEYLSKVLSKKFPVFNSHESLLLSDDKMRSVLEVEKVGIKTPKTIPAPLCYKGKLEEEELLRTALEIEKRLSYPIVMKECHGSLGKQVMLLRSRSELLENLDTYKSTPHLYSEFLSKNAGRDYRILTVGDEVVACMERKNDHDFRSNIALGGIGSDCTETIPEAFKKTALKASKALKLDYAGIDLAIGEHGEPIFLEANGNAFFSEIEKVTGKNIAQKIALHIKNKLKL